MPTLTKPAGVGGLLAKRIPTLLGLGILALGVVVGIVLVGQGTGGFLPRAAEGATPKQVRITNITDTGFTVSFLTDTASPGYIKYGQETNRLPLQVADDRDQLTGGSSEYTTHHVSVRGLQPTTQYYFQIGTGSRNLFDNRGQSFAVRTAQRLQNPPEAQTAYGNLNNEVGNPAEGAILYLSIQGASPLSALVKTNGSWAVPISTVRTTDLSALFSLTGDTSVRIQAVGTARNQTLELTAMAQDLSPLYDLRFGQEPQALAESTATASAVTSNTAGSALGSLFSEGEGNQVDSATPVQITSVTEGETISTDRPEFSGKAPPNTQLQIQVHSETNYDGTAQANADGTWTWVPPGNLEPGQHTITVSYTDANGVLQTVERNFIVQASTGVPAFTATPSGVIATPTPVPTVLPTPAPTPTPLITPEPTPAVGMQQQPVSGTSWPLAWLTGLALVFLGVGVWSNRLAGKSDHD